MRKQRVVFGILIVTAVLLVGVLVVFAFGTPQGSVAPLPPGAEAPGAGGAATGPDPAAGGDPAASAVTTGEVPAPDPGSPLAIEIPGCVCHSDDPAIVEEHSQYRMNQCFGCHAGGMPEMGQ